MREDDFKGFRLFPHPERNPEEKGKNVPKWKEMNGLSFPAFVPLPNREKFRIHPKPLQSAEFTTHKGFCGSWKGGVEKSDLSQ